MSSFIKNVPLARVRATFDSGYLHTLIHTSGEHTVAVHIFKSQYAAGDTCPDTIRISDNAEKIRAHNRESNYFYLN